MTTTDKVLSEQEYKRLLTCERAWIACFEALFPEGWHERMGMLTGSESPVAEIKRLQDIEKEKS